MKVLLLGSISFACIRIITTAENYSTVHINMIGFVIIIHTGIFMIIFFVKDVTFPLDQLHVLSI